MILLYHLIFSDDAPPDQWTAGYVMRLRDFKKQVRWLKKRFPVVALEAYLAVEKKERNRLIAITFDDGYRETFKLIQPFLQRESIPATFFINTNHLEEFRLLWFVYFNALCFEKVYLELIIADQPYPLDTHRACTHAWKALIEQAQTSGDAIGFADSYSEKYPLPETVISKYIGLDEAQLSTIGKSTLLEAGGHTHSHPYLDQIPYEQQLHEIKKNKRIIENITKKPVRYFAYTGGVYNAESISAVKHVGFDAALAVKPRHFMPDENFELARTDIYSPALWKLKLKVHGIESLARKIIKNKHSQYD